MKNVSKQNSHFQIVKKSIAGLLSISIFFVSLPTVAAIPRYSAFDEYELINSRTKELNLSVFANIQLMIDQNQFDLSQYIPYAQLPKQDDGSVISRKILKKTLRTISENETLYAGLTTAAQNVSTAFSTEVKSNGHSFNFKLRALETQAEVVYNGPVQAKISYDAQDNEALVEVSKNISGKTIAFNHIENQDGNTDIIGIRWAF